MEGAGEAGPQDTQNEGKQQQVHNQHRMGPLQAEDGDCHHLLTKHKAGID